MGRRAHCRLVSTVNNSAEIRWGRPLVPRGNISSCLVGTQALARTKRPNQGVGADQGEPRYLCRCRSNSPAGRRGLLLYGLLYFVA